jgi:hypothetical protein
MQMPCTEAIDVTGPARILVFGPYAQLAPGRWRVTARFEVSAEAATRSYYVEFGQGADFEGVMLHPSGAGVYEMSLERTLAGKTTVELRLWLARAAFRGSLRFLQATAERLDHDAARPPVRRKRKSDAS